MGQTASAGQMSDILTTELRLHPTEACNFHHSGIAVRLLCLKQEPIFSKVQPAFQYTSHVSLQAPSGHMWWVHHFHYVTLSRSSARVL